MNLIIVESPTKAKTLSRFLADDGNWQIESTMGHVRDLPKSKLGIDIEHDFTPDYQLLPGKEQRVKTIRQASGQADTIYIATDPDREGEAIAHHLSEILSGRAGPGMTPSRVTRPRPRIVFHEITKQAVEEALTNPREIDMDLVNAQQARRVLDRLVGYKLSPLLWRKVRRGLSAGRVQSVAVRLIVEREREIEKFAKIEYWKVFGVFAKDGELFTAELVGHGEQKFYQSEIVKLFAGRHIISKTTIASQLQAQDLVLDFGGKFTVDSVIKREALRRAGAPFITSTLQQAAYHRLHLSSSQTMRIAQKLYEHGLITYHRTDSTHLAIQAVAKIRDYIKKSFGGKYLPAAANIYQTRSKVAQEAHEAIRPTEVNFKFQISNFKFGNEEGKLYDLIWKQTVASQMTPAVVEETTVKIRSDGDYIFQAQGEKIIFDGWWKVAGVPRDENLLPTLVRGEQLSPDCFSICQNFTSPPPRYSDASLIATLEREGIGRPSTYAPIITTIQTRQYVDKIQGRFWPTAVGIATNDFLVDNFPDIDNLPFTAKMEDDLDQIADGKKDWIPVIKDFWQPFANKLETVGQKAKRVKIEVEKTGEKCPKCSAGDQVIRLGRFGKFLSCSRFPDCDWTEQYVEKIDMKCPDCGRGDIIIRKTRRGRRFFGCSQYPACKFASWKQPLQP